jgi:hypothetical protein
MKTQATPLDAPICVRVVINNYTKRVGILTPHGIFRYRDNSVYMTYHKFSDESRYTNIGPDDFKSLPLMDKLAIVQLIENVRFVTKTERILLRQKYNFN